LNFNITRDNFILTIKEKKVFIIVFLIDTCAKIKLFEMRE